MSAAHLQWRAEELWLQLRGLLPGLSVEVVERCLSTNTTLLERARVDVRPEPDNGDVLVQRGEVELVFSTGGVFSAHLAGYWLKRWTGCRWIVEVHDPLVIPGRAPQGRHERLPDAGHSRTHAATSDCASAPLNSSQVHQIISA